MLTGLLAVPILGERITPLQMLGGVAVLLGIYVVHRSRAALTNPSGPAGEEALGQLIEAGQIAPERVGQSAGDDGRAETVE